MKRKRAQLCRQLSGRCTGALAYSLSLIRRMCMLNSAVRLPSSTPSAWKGAQSRTGRTKKMDQSWENLSALFFIGTNWRARTEFMLKSRLYITIHHLQISFTYMSLTHCHLMMGTKLRLSGWMGTVSTKASFSKMDSLRAPVSSLGVWSLYLHRCTSEGTTWFHLGQQPFSLVTRNTCFNSSIK